MKRTKIHMMAAAALVLSVASCKPTWDMIAPPTASNSGDDLDDEDFYGNQTDAYYVTVYGDGEMDGSSWENALDQTAFLDLLTDNSDVSKTTFYLAEGKYLMGNAMGFGLTVSKNVGTIQGGYNPLSEGTATTDRDVTAHPTVFSGDVNGDGKADDGDCTLIRLTGGTITFDGIIFENGYVDETYETADKTYCSGLSVAGTLSTTLNLENCVIRNCVNAATTNGIGGGAAVMICGGYARLRDTKITGCTGTSRGAAIRCRDTDESVIFLDRCSISGCSQSSSWGMAVQLSNGCAGINNSTLYQNSGTGAQLNGGGAMIVTNSTIVACESDSYGAIRGEASSGVQQYFVNSLFFSPSSDKPSFVKNKANSDICSKGWCAYMSVRYDAGSDFGNSSDVTLSSTPNGKLDENGVFVWDPSSIKQSTYATAEEVYNIVNAMSPSTVSTLGADFAAWVGQAGFGVDQRNVARNTGKMYIGAYDNGASK